MEKKRTAYLVFRIVSSILALILLILFIAPLAINNIRDIGNIFGIVFCAVYLIWVNNLFGVGRLKKKIKEHKVSKIVLNIIYSLVVIGVVYGIAVSASMVTAIVKTPEPQSTVVVLGCKVNGKNPSLMLRSAWKRRTVILKSIQMCPASYRADRAQTRVSARHSACTIT